MRKQAKINGEKGKLSAQKQLRISLDGKIGRSEWWTGRDSNPRPSGFVGFYALQTGRSLAHSWIWHTRLNYRPDPFLTTPRWKITIMDANRL